MHYTLLRINYNIKYHPNHSVPSIIILLSMQTLDKYSSVHKCSNTFKYDKIIFKQIYYKYEVGINIVITYSL